MDFHSMFEEMHAAMEEMMGVRRSMVDRMFEGFGPSVFPWFSSLQEEFDRDFQRDFAFPRLPLLTERRVHPTSAALGTPASGEAGAAAAPKAQPQQQPLQAQQPPQQQKSVQPQRSSPVETSVMYSTQQCYNSADPSKNFSRHTTTQLGPQGVMESRTAVRDNREGEERIEVRRQLGDRYTHVTRKRRLDTGEETVERKSHNLQGEELAPFEEEWNKLAKQFLPMYHGEGRLEPPAAIASGEAPKATEAGAAGKALPVGNAPAPAQAQPTTVSLQK